MAWIRREEGRSDGPSRPKGTATIVAYAAVEIRIDPHALCGVSAAS